MEIKQTFEEYEATYL